MRIRVWFRSIAHHWSRYGTPTLRSCRFAFRLELIREEVTLTGVALSNGAIDPQSDHPPPARDGTAKGEGEIARLGARSTASRPGLLAWTALPHELTAISLNPVSV